MARQLGGDVVGHQVLAPGPNHTPRDRSMSVRFSPSAPDGFVVFSHSGDDMGACRDHVRERLGWQREAHDRAPQVRHAEPRSPDPVPDDAAKVERARAIWREAVDPIGTVVERYLASRGLDLPWRTAGAAIRFHPACPWRDEASGTTIRVPAMVAAMRCIRTERLTAVHRTRLTLDGRKVDRRMLGKASGAAVHLCPMSALGAGLTLGEGIETCLAASSLGWENVWAACSVGAIERFPLLPGLQSVILLAETDDSGASERAIQAVGSLYAEAGREVLIARPRVGGDMNDALRSAA